jgi:hypothetical protein
MLQSSKKTAKRKSAYYRQDSRTRFFAISFRSGLKFQPFSFFRLKNIIAQTAMTTAAIITPPAITAFPKTSPAVCLEVTPKNIKNAAKTIAISESAFIFLVYKVFIVSVKIEKQDSEFGIQSLF